jgi:ABC-type branched-subunit amino acid transport system substrate-binding protein
MRRLYSLLISLLVLSTPVVIAARQEAVRIGILLTPDSQADRGARLAVQELNAMGSGSYELVYPSSLDDMPAAVDALEGVQAIIGPVSDENTLPNLELLAGVGVPVLTLAMGNLLTEQDSQADIFRVRAAEAYYSAAAMDYLLNELGSQRIVLVQTDVPSTEALLEAENRLIELGSAPFLKVQLLDNTELLANVSAITEGDAVAFWGAAEDALSLRRELLAAGWTGSFFYRYTQEAVLSGTIPSPEAAGMFGVSGWSYATPTRLSRQFLASYAATYGEIPTDEAAAAYDAVYVLAGRMQQGGSLVENLRGMPEVLAVQGYLRGYENGDLSRLTTVYRIEAGGAAVLMSRYQDNARLTADDLITYPEVLAAIGTPTPTLIPSETPLPTLTPTATPSQLLLTVIGSDVPVYEGPGTDFERLGALPLGAKAAVLGGNTNLDWLAILYRGQIGWVIRNPASLQEFDPGGLFLQIPVLSAPALPEGSGTPTSLIADIIIENVTLEPAQPVPGEAFVANVTLRNNGQQATGPFTIATAFEPGAVYSSNNVTNIEAGASLSLPLSATLVGSGDYGVDILADINNTVAEGDGGERNNSYRLNYRVDYRIVNLVEQQEVPAGNRIDLAGGTPDLEWTGTVLTPINGASIGVLTGLTYDAVSYDILEPVLLNNTTGLDDTQIFSGVLIGVLTAEGQRAIIRVEERSGTTLIMQFRVYE